MCTGVEIAAIGASVLAAGGAVYSGQQQKKMSNYQAAQAEADAEAAQAAREPECQYVEIQSCSGTGMGYCNMQFHDGNGSTLAVVTTEGPPPGAIVNRWKQEARKPTPVATGQAAKLSKQQCERFLGAGMYNSVLEQLCDFNGGVAQKILSLYEAGACRATVPQSVVDKTSKEVLSGTQKRYEVMGKAAFCEGNWSAYHELMKAQ